MAKLIIAVGLPGSGKDYEYYNNNCRETEEVIMVSSDKIREELYGDASVQTNPAKVFQIMYDRTVATLAKNQNVYYNATNLVAKRRKALIQNIRSDKRLSKIDIQIIAYLVVPPYEVCFERNSKRDRVVPQYAMERMFKSFEPPHKSEGWDTIRVTGCDGDMREIIKILDKADKMPHDNHHHPEYIGTHMRLAEEKAKLLEPENLVLRYAARTHDLGKVYCKTFTNRKGEPTDEAHFYNHQNVGTYIWLSHCYLFTFGMISEIDFKIAHLIFNHMKFFEGEKAIKKVREKYGEEFYDTLLKLHACDIAAKGKSLE